MLQTPSLSSSISEALGVSIDNCKGGSWNQRDVSQKTYRHYKQTIALLLYVPYGSDA